MKPTAWLISWHHSSKHLGGNLEKLHCCIQLPLYYQGITENVWLGEGTARPPAKFRHMLNWREKRTRHPRHAPAPASAGSPPCCGYRSARRRGHSHANLRTTSR